MVITDKKDHEEKKLTWKRHLSSREKRDQEERTMNSGKEGLTNEKGYAQRKEPERIILNR